MNRMIFFVFLALFLLFTGCPEPGSTSPIDKDTDKEHGNFTYTENNGKLTITGFSSAGMDETNIEIPDSIQEKPVQFLGENAFKDTKIITAVIPEGILSIGAGAFKNTPLESLTLEALAAPAVGKDAFPLGNTGLTLRYPAGGTGYGNSPWTDFPIQDAYGTPPPKDNFEYTLINNDSEVLITGITSSDINKETLTIPDTLENKPVTTIGEDAFKSMSQLDSVTISASVTEIRAGAFFSTPLTRVIMKADTAPSVSETAFPLGNVGGVGLSYPITGRGYSVDPWKSFLNRDVEGSLEVSPEAIFKTQSDNGTVTITGFQDGVANVSAIRIPSTIGTETVVAIGSGAFVQDRNLVTVVIPDSVTTIGEWAFSSMSSLETVFIGTGMEAPSGLGMGAFHGTRLLGYFFIASPVAPYSTVNPQYSTLDSFVENANLLYPADGQGYGGLPWDSFPVKRTIP